MIVMAGEFGRTPFISGGPSYKTPGRNHWGGVQTVLLAGGGIQPGLVLGRTDDFGYNIVEDPVNFHDLHATMLHLLGIEHTKLTYRFEGRDYRLTDISGELVKPLIA